MARIRLAPGEWGGVQLNQMPNGRWRARVLYRAASGETKRVQRVAATKTAAKRDALQAVEQVARVGVGTQSDCTVKELVETYLEWGRAHKWRPQTADQYDYHAEKDVYPAMGSLLAREGTTPIFEHHLQAIKQPSRRRAARVLLRGAYGHGLRIGIVTSNPVEGTTPVPRPRPTAAAITPADMETVRGAIRAWQSATPVAGGRAPYLLHFLDVLIGSGARPNEILGLRWEDVDIPTRQITLKSTVTRHSGEDGKSHLFLQEATKTARGFRAVTLPDWSMTALELQRLSPWGEDGGKLTTPPGLVFPSSHGGLMDLANVRRSLRDALKHTGIAFHPYLLRSTALTAVADVYGMVAARDVAGHTTTAITESHYVQRAAVAPDVSGALGDYRPKS